MIARGVKRMQLLNLALELYDEERCSVCDTEFEPEAFTNNAKLPGGNCASIRDCVIASANRTGSQDDASE
jgi:hypothetical protein